MSTFTSPIVRPYWPMQANGIYPECKSNVLLNSPDQKSWWCGEDDWYMGPNEVDQLAPIPMVRLYSRPSTCVVTGAI